MLLPDAGNSADQQARSTVYKTVVDVYIEEIEKQAAAIKDPALGLDRDFNWINVNALILIGCLKCSGSDR